MKPMLTANVTWMIGAAILPPKAAAIQRADSHCPGSRPTRIRGLSLVDRRLSVAGTSFRETRCPLWRIAISGCFTAPLQRGGGGAAMTATATNIA